MPWKETSSVNERLRFIGLVNDSEDSFAALCEQFGISRKTGYKWAERYERLGPRGLEEARPVARSFPHATPAAVLDALIELRKERPTWGPKKLRARLESQGVQPIPAASTIGELLKKLVECRAKNEWPGRYPEEEALLLPAWAAVNRDEVLTAEVVEEAA